MKNIFVGWLFVFFHVKISGFDLLADFAGYALIFAGLNEISDKSVCFEKAKPWAVGMSVVNFLVCVGPIFGFDFWNTIPNVISALTVLVNLYLLYLISIGIREMEQKEERELGSQTLLQIWKVLVAADILWAILSFVPREEVLLIAAVFGLIGVIMNIAYLVTFYKTGKRYQADRSSE